jgi:hypothetical protein
MDLSEFSAGETINVYERWSNIPNHVWDVSEGRWVPYETV